MNLPWTWNDDELLIKLIGEHGIVYWSDKRITFKSGIKSHVYVSGRSDLTGSGEALDIIASMLAYMTRHALSQEILDHKRIQFIGVPTAGTPIAAVAGAVRVPGM